MLSTTTLAQQINAEHEAVCRAAYSALEHAKRGGELLCDVKASLPHGRWLPWLAEHCPTIPERTAQAYMRIARYWPTLEAKTQRVADLPIRQALALLAEPEDHPRWQQIDEGDLDAIAEKAAEGIAGIYALGARLRTEGGPFAESDDGRMILALSAMPREELAEWMLTLPAIGDDRHEDSVFTAHDRDRRAELRVLARTVDAPDATIEELRHVIARCEQIGGDAYADRIRALAALGKLLNVCQAQPGGATVT
jgi:hypothetical protein